MKKIISLLFLLSIFIGSIAAQDIAVTDCGKKVILNSNGTWYYKDEEQKEEFQVIDLGAKSPDLDQGQVVTRIRNNSTVDYSVVTIVFDLFLDDKMVGTEEDAIFGFESGTIRTASIYTNIKFNKYIISVQQKIKKY